MIEAAARRRTTILATGVVASFATALAFWIFPNPPRFFAAMGVGDPVPGVGWASAAVVAIAYISYTMWAVPAVRIIAVELSWFRLLAIPLALLSGVVEEMFYRRVVMDGLASTGTSLLGQIVISAVIFAAVHSVWALFSKSWRIVLPVVGSTAALGVLLALVYVASDRVVFPAVLAHIAINLMIEPGLLYSAAKDAVQGNQRKAIPSPSLITPK